jgi:hypothetical protein
MSKKTLLLFGPILLALTAASYQAIADDSATDSQDDSDEGVTVQLPPDESANNDNAACGAVMCLFGEMVGQKGGGDCPDYEKTYFSIRVYKHGSFSPSRTAAKRLEFLNKCPSSVPGTREGINSIYGPLFDGP